MAPSDRFVDDGTSNSAGALCISRITVAGQSRIGAPPGSTITLKPQRAIEGTLSLLFRGGGMKHGLAEGITRFELLIGASVLADNLMRCARDTGEKLWQLPLVKEYREALKSSVADMKNVAGP